MVLARRRAVPCSTSAAPLQVETQVALSKVPLSAEMSIGPFEAVGVLATCAAAASGKPATPSAMPRIAARHVLIGLSLRSAPLRRILLMAFQHGVNAAVHDDRLAVLRRRIAARLDLTLRARAGHRMGARHRAGARVHQRLAGAGGGVGR